MLVRTKTRDVKKKEGSTASDDDDDELNDNDEEWIQMIKSKRKYSTTRPTPLYFILNDGIYLIECIKHEIVSKQISTSNHIIVNLTLNKLDTIRI